jgi:hypothetical protein
MDFSLEVNVGKQSVDVATRSNMGKSLGYVAGREDLMAPILDHRCGHFPNENIIFDHQNHCHFEKLSAAGYAYWLGRKVPQGPRSRCAGEY